MAEIEVKAKATLADGSTREVAIQYDFGNNLSEMQELFDDETVFANAKAQMVINLQAYLRRLAGDPKEGEQPLTDEEIQAKAKEWKPGNKQVTRKSNAEKVSELLGKMSAEEKAKLLASLAG